MRDRVSFPCPLELHTAHTGVGFFAFFLVQADKGLLIDQGRVQLHG